VAEFERHILSGIASEGWVEHELTLDEWSDACLLLDKTKMTAVWLRLAGGPS
jgi:hypothetical protein